MRLLEANLVVSRNRADIKSPAEDENTPNCKALQARTLSDKAAVTEAEEEHSRVEPIADQSPINIRYLGSLQIPVRLAPPIFVDDIGQRNTANGSEPAHRVANRQQGI
jgi:hypothetical protein